MKGKQILLVMLISAVTAVSSVWTYNKFFKIPDSAIGTTQNGIPGNYAGFFDGRSPNVDLDFTKAANSSVPGVVHIKTRTAAKKQTNNVPRNRGMFDDWFEDFFGGPNSSQEQRASGSGVLISEDGYIVTNNHVVSNGGEVIAEELTVTLHNKKTYKARLIGRDPSSDLAVLKIDGNKFPFLLYGNSNNLQLGQWVLAIGYPLTLETTVTAGIISATGRTININRRQTSTGDSPVESFIQTDAAVNFGSSGGALVNTNGELIGINSAILAPSGTYAGYSFAIPVSIVRKIVDDIVKFGDVQRGYLGIVYEPTEGMSEEEIKARGLSSSTEGVIVKSVARDGGAYAAGIRDGDVITKINNVAVLSGIQMSAQIAGFRPGDRIPVAYIRNGREQAVSVTLKKKSDDLLSVNIGSRLGAEISTLDKSKAKQLGINGGVVVKKIAQGGAIGRTRMQEGFVITSVSGQDVNSVEELSKVLSKMSGSVSLEGIYPGSDGPYRYPLNLEQ